MTHLLPPSGTAADAAVPAGTAVPGEATETAPRATAQVAVRGALWSSGASLVARATSMVATLGLTHYLDPQAVGEVTTAAILAVSAHQISQLGIPHFLVTRPRADPHEAYNATILSAALAAAAMAVSILASGSLSGPLGLPALGSYLPWLALSAFGTRLATIPERMLQRDLRFREASLARAAAELAYAVTAIALAASGTGAMAIVGGNLARSTVHLGAMASLVPLRAWLAPSAGISLATMRRIVAFGAPLSAAVMLGLAARSWDNLLVSATWGAAAVGAYNLAYNLADVPATHVGEPIGDVLVPALVKLSPEARRRALLRAVGLATLVVAPLAVGLSVVAPTLVGVALRRQWAAVAPMLSVLALLGVVRPIGWTVGSHLTATGRTRTVLLLGVVLVAVLFPAMAGLGALLGPVGAGGGVLVGFGVHAALALAIAARQEGLGAQAVIGSLAGPLAACAVLAASVLGVRAALAPLGVAGLAALVIEIATGAVAYVAAGLVVARSQSRDFLELIAGVLQKRTKELEPKASR